MVTALTPDLLPRFMQLRARKVPIKLIAAELGITRGVIAHNVARLKLQYAPADRPKPPRPPRVRHPIAEIAPERARAGLAPLEPGHPLTWGVISTEPWSG